MHGSRMLSCRQQGGRVCPPASLLSSAVIVDASMVHHFLHHVLHADARHERRPTTPTSSRSRIWPTGTHWRKRGSRTEWAEKGHGTDGPDLGWIDFPLGYHASFFFGKVQIISLAVI